ncbi:MAG: hypothetical protein ACRCU9_15550 [Iodobacter sp.]
MSKYNNEYYFILEERNERLPDLSPDEDTANRKFRFQEIPQGSKPLVFIDSGLEYMKKQRIKPLDTPPNILFEGSNLVVKDYIREKIMWLAIPDLVIQPSIYIDHKNVWHENYWYCTFTKLFECWNKKTSTYDPEPLDLNNIMNYEVYTYDLDDKLLSETPLNERLIFKMGGTTEGNIVVHKSLAGLFKTSGAVLVPISDFGVTYP